MKWEKGGLSQILCGRLWLLPGVVACACNRATSELIVSNGVRLGVLLYCNLCRSGVHTKLGVNMVKLGEPSSTRLNKEERTHFLENNFCLKLTDTNPLNLDSLGVRVVRINFSFQIE